MRKEEEEGRGEAGGDVWMDKMAGWIARCGQILAQPPEEVGGRLKSLFPSFTASLKPKDLRIKLGHWVLCMDFECCMWFGTLQVYCSLQYIFYIIKP